MSGPLQSGRSASDRRAITVVAVGDDGVVERRFTINPEDRERKLDVLRAWTGDAYVEVHEARPREVNVMDWPLLPGGQPVHGVEGATFAFPDVLPESRAEASDG